MKKLLLVLIAVMSLVLILNLSLFAQDEKVAHKSFYSEIGGPGVLMSANFDSRFSSDSQFGFGYRVGIGYLYGEYSNDYVERAYFTIPVGLNYIFGKPDSVHSFEIGTGTTLLPRKAEIYYYGNSDNKKLSYALGFFTFMYRRTPEGGGFSWRIGLTPLIDRYGDIFPMGSFSIGFIF